MGPLAQSANNYLELITHHDTIIACATPSSSPMGIAIIRISGEFILSDFNKLLEKSGPMGPLKARYATLLNIVDPTTSLVVDQAIATYFPGPASFTGENVLELSVHGNPRLVDKVIELFVEHFSLRIASPGEFTLRAFRNKKLSLTQVEGLDLLLHASTQPLIELSQNMLNGNLQNEFLALKNALDKHNAAIDILTDFSDDIGEDVGYAALEDSWKEAVKIISDFHARSQVPLDYLLKPTIVLYGPPNAGKSTLFNLLVGYKRSIVSPEAGTTRDYVKESLFIDKNEFFLIDTAGIRETVNMIEEEGIYFTFKNLESAFSRVFVYSAEHFNEKEFEQFVERGSPTLLIISHAKKIKNLEIFKTQISKFYTNKIFFFELSDSVQDLSDFKKYFLTDLGAYFSKKPIIAERQRAEILKLNEKLLSYNALIMSDLRTDLGVVSHEFNQVRNLANNLIGIVDTDEILNYVFSNFCIGK